MSKEKELEKLKTFSDYPGFAMFEELRELNQNLETLNQEELKKGEKGDQGEPGEKGEQGEPGRDGKDGKNGLNGKDGKDGIDGLDGIDGENGLNGKDGSPDTGLQIKAKLLALSDEDKLKLKDLGGFDALIAQIEKMGVRRNVSVPQSGITTTFFSLEGAIKGRAKNINFISGTTLEVVLQGDTATVTIPTGGSGDTFPPTGEITYYSGTITTGGTAQLVIPVNKLRDHLYFQNTSANNMYIDFGNDPTVTSFPVFAGDIFEMDVSTYIVPQSLRVLGTNNGDTFVAWET